MINKTRQKQNKTSTMNSMDNEKKINRDIQKGLT